eukprot:3900034-Rhodomonas_salina.1
MLFGRDYHAMIQVLRAWPSLRLRLADSGSESEQIQTLILVRLNLNHGLSVASRCGPGRYADPETRSSGSGSDSSGNLG